MSSGTILCKLAILVWGLHVLFCCIGVAFATQASERESHSVEVTFYQLSKSEWRSVDTAFRTLVATEAASYCATNTDCGLSAGFSFTSSGVGVYSGPTEASRSLKIRFYIAFPSIHIPSSPPSTTYVVNAATTAKILRNVRTAAEAAVGRDITHIGEEFYSIDPDARLNVILIPLAFLLLLLLLALAFGLHVWSKGKEKEERKRVKVLEQEKRKKSGRVTPSPARTHDSKQFAALSDSERAPSKLLPISGQTTPTNNNNSNRVTVRNNTLPPLETTPVKKDKTKKERKRKQEEEKQQEEKEKENAVQLKEMESGKERQTSKEREVIVVEEIPPPRIFL